MNSTLRQNQFRSTVAVWVVLLLLCCYSNETKAQQTASQTVPGATQNQQPSVEAAPVAEKEDAAAKDAVCWALVSFE